MGPPPPHLYHQPGSTVCQRLVYWNFSNHLQESRSEDEDALLQSHDGQQLIRILDELTEHKDDSQQRTWAVHEDEGILHKLLKELLSILVSTKSFFYTVFIHL